MRMNFSLAIIAALNVAVSSATYLQAQSSSLALTQNFTAEDQKYEQMSQTMAKWGYEWNAFEVTTKDDYILTTFQILPKQGGATGKGSVLMQHGLSFDGAHWLTKRYATEKPYHLELVDAGFDVWLGNNRGTKYSQGHSTLNATTDAKFWDFTWHDMGLYDLRASIDDIKARTSEDKLYYVGYSQGSAQMHYALAKDQDEYFKDNLHKIVSLAPCFISTHGAALGNNIDMFTQSVGSFIELGVVSINGPHWSQFLQGICKYDTSPQKMLCNYYTNARTNEEAVSVKSEQLWFQNSLMGRFQEWSEDWKTASKAQKKTQLVDVSKISDVPMTFIFAGEDTSCPPAVQKQFVEQITAPKKSITIDGKSHSYFGSPTDESFAGVLAAELKLEDETCEFEADLSDLE